MGSYKYKARDKFATLVSGLIDADTKDAALKSLNDMGYIPISIVQIKKLSADKILEKFQRVGLDEVSTFTRQLLSLQKAGIPLLSSIEALSQQTKTKYFSAVLERVAVDIRSGLSLSQALAKHPRIFDDIYIGMIKAAETAGALTAVLERLIELIECDIDIRAKIKSATRYPLIVIFTLCVGFIVLIAFVIPRFSTLYSQFGALLPLPTRILIAINTFLTNFWYLMLIGIFVVIYSFIRFINSKTGKPLWHNFKLKVPVFGPLTLMLIMSRFTRITGMLMRSGVPILDILDLAKSAAGNIIISRAIGNIKESVNQGKGMSGPMKVSGLFPVAVIQMVSAGERSGKVDELLISVSDYYDREAGYTIRNLTTYIEPMLIFVLAIMVMTLALGIFMPMWNLIRVFRPS